MSKPICFISYSRDNDDHIAWVKKLAEDIKGNDMDILFDQNGLRAGKDLAGFMEKSIRKCNYFFAVCTRKYAEKVDGEENSGVAYEKSIVTGEILHGIRSPDTVIPILREGDRKISIPSYLKSKIYIDLRDDTTYNANLDKLLEQLFEESDYVPKIESSMPLFVESIVKRPQLDTHIIATGGTLTIGYIASSTINLETAKPYLEQIIAPTLTNYARSVGRNINIRFLIEDAQGQATKHLEKLQVLHSMGVDLVIGGGWSSQAYASLLYINANNMLLVSPSSTSPTLAIPNDRFFRMCSSDTNIAPVLSDVMWAAGVKTIIIFQRGDSWGDGIVNQLLSLWMKKGGDVAGEIIRYEAESTEFSTFLALADQVVLEAITKHSGERQRVGVVVLSFDEIPVILKQATSYPNIYNVHWWGCDGTAKSQRAMDDAPMEANHVGLYSLLARDTLTPKFFELQEKYVKFTNQQFSTYSAYVYDAALAIVNSVFETGSTDAGIISAAFPTICYKLFGATGWCRLNSAGDRYTPPYDVWGFFPSKIKASVSQIMAQYEPDFRTTTFSPSVLGYTPLGP